MLLTVGKDIPYAIENVRKETCPLCVVVGTEKYSHLSPSELQANLKQVTKALNVEIGCVVVMDY